jgi:hypothetical protein
LPIVLTYTVRFVFEVIMLLFRVAGPGGKRGFEKTIM